MEKLYSKYFQKSYTFLYPLLGIPKHPVLKPSQVYLEWQYRSKLEDPELICLFTRNPIDKLWIDFEQCTLFKHKQLRVFEKISNEVIALVFDLKAYEEDYGFFLKGFYSKFSEGAKNKIITYYGNSPEFTFLESFLYPEKYHQVYASLLDVNPDVILKSHELCEIFNREKEKCLLVRE
jgi:hypothetical protein